MKLMKHAESFLEKAKQQQAYQADTLDTNKQANTLTNSTLYFTDNTPKIPPLDRRRPARKS